MAPSQEDKWKWMVNQDPCSGSVAGDSGHGTMTATGEDESMDNTKELIGTVGESMRELLLNTSQMSNGEMMTHCLCSMMIMSQSPRPQLPPQPLFKHVRKKTKPLLWLNCLSGKSPAFENLLPNSYQRELQFTSNLTITM